MTHIVVAVPALRIANIVLTTRALPVPDVRRAISSQETPVKLAIIMIRPVLVQVGITVALTEPVEETLVPCVTTNVTLVLPTTISIAIPALITTPLVFAIHL